MQMMIKWSLRRNKQIGGEKIKDMKQPKEGIYSKMLGK